MGFDNFSYSKPDLLGYINDITGKDIKFYEGNMLDGELLRKIFSENTIDVVVDFAAYKAVGDSVVRPVEYYTNNVSSVLVLLSVMKEFNVKSIIFSSSATVYGDPEKLPLTEDCKVGGTTNPYGTSKYFVERILQDLCNGDKEFKAIIFRYFNPIGAHESGLLGEDPNGVPANLVPFIDKVATGKQKELKVFGNDYNTPDGTGVRDYIHIVDLAKAHICGVNKLLDTEPGCYIYNLGTGTGYSVLDIVNTYMKVNNLEIPYVIAERRPGDVDSNYADSSKALEELGWKAEKNLEDMCRDAYGYAKNH